jgi:mannosyltransferase
MNGPGVSLAGAPEREHGRPFRSLDFPVVALTAFSIALACIRLGTKSLNADETVSAHYAQLGLGDLWHVITGPDPNMGLYYVLLHFWAQIFGVSEAALRSLGVLLSCFAIGLIVAIGTQLFGRRAGLIAGLLLAVDAAFVASEQEARAYGPVVTVTLLSTYLFLRALERPTPQRIATYAMASIVAVYFHYFAALLLVVHLLALLTRDDQRQHARSWALAGSAIVVCSVPELLFARGDRLNVAWIQRPSLHDLAGFPGYLAAGDIHGGSIAAGFFAIAIAYWLLTGFRRRYRWATCFALAWLVVPVILTFVESTIGQSFWVNQYMIIVLAPCLMLVGAGLAAAPRREITVAAVVLAVVLLAIDLQRLYQAPPSDNYRAAARYLFSHEQPGDVALYNASVRTGIGSRYGYVDDGIVYYAARMHANAPRSASIRDLTAARTAKPRRVWFVMRGTIVSTDNARAYVVKAIGGEYAETHSAKDFVTGPTVALFVRRQG